MDVISLVYNRILRRFDGSRSLGQRCRRLALEILIGSLSRLGDPTIRTAVRGKPMAMPISHRLPLYVRLYPHYDALLTRLSDFLRARQGRLSMIDVGANVGDTVLACSGQDSDRFLAIEPNRHFSRHFRTNCGHLRECRLLEVVCAATDGAAEFTIDQGRGTARVRAQSGGRTIESRSLDRIVAENPAASDFNLLKVDTDGHDFDVLRGARSSIAANLPAVLFECDMFGNEHYVEDFVETMTFFAETGYRIALVYDNLGYLFATLDLDQPGTFKHTLFYQLTGPLPYVDILLTPPALADAFLAAEHTHFVDSLTDDVLKTAARAAARL